ncbi:MAG: SUF system Fe-S cluster assembly regulator [Legionellaceae bacterium]|nr:SUF system Fe-S cluster assembly regulator [Legionellaceae bacterium]
MLRISKLADYGTVVMVFLAKQAQGLSNARLIARETRLAVPTVSKILKKLAAAGLLISERGTNGGYRLGCPASEISLAQIIYALEEQRGLTECSMHASDCALQGHCAIQGNWRLISQAVETALDSVSLAALARPLIQQADLERVKQLVSGEHRE